jgi:hypothetical protein
MKEKRSLVYLSKCLIVACGFHCAVHGFHLNSAWADDSSKAKAGDEQLLSRIDFGNAYVMGQSIKSGAVYLLNRKKSEIRSMLKCRTDYRAEIKEDAEVVDASSD